MTALEAIARAVCCGDAACYNESSGCACVSMDDSAAGRASPFETALAILAALREAGYGVVPAEPSEAAWKTAEALLCPGMRVTCDTRLRVHRAMLAAAEKDDRDA
jgi:hypothetical protein